MEEVERLLQALHSKQINPLLEDKLLLKGSKTGGFSMKLMYKVLDHSPALAFPSLSIWNLAVPPKLGFFAAVAFRGKVLTLDQLKNRGRALVNKCFLCEEDEETTEHLLVHCKKARMLWDLFLAIVETS